MERLVIIGGGMAAARLINRLTELAPDRYAITLVGDEPSLPYDRVQLSSVLAGERSQEELRTGRPSNVSCSFRDSGSNHSAARPRG